ncbi:dehydrogenase/reductase SDR family member 4-like [Cylas formicarius]|uniref:dehydrogenase/reductase SDR family member 4-like n=1 Tax=Cylas formicarius TaxID=197179 RepID=UPI002958961A|nr:dehydrogenase/reductase SDR family member 4-like [Cylas formicarius]
MALKRLSGKIAIVTASTDGIGLAIARRLGNEGAKVIISSRKEPNVLRATKELTDEGLEVKGLVCHVSNQDERNKLFEEAKKLGGLDILVSNAAVNPFFGGMLDCDEKMFDKIFDVNVKSSFLLAREALPFLRKSQQGRIIFISSISAYMVDDILGPYSFSKTALLGLTKTIAKHLGPDGITVNCVCPGHIETRFSHVMRKTDEIMKEELKKIPMGRLGQAHEIAPLIAFLASEDGSYITGENIVAAGGLKTRI